MESRAAMYGFESDIQHQGASNGAKAPVNVLLVSSTDFRWIGLRVALAQSEAINVVGDARSLDQARRFASAQRPDVVLAATDIMLVPLGRLLPTLQDASPNSRVVAIGMQPARGESMALVHLGLAAHVLWSDVDLDTVVLTLRLARREGIRIGSESMLTQLLQEVECFPPVVPDVSVTERDLAILCHLASGQTQNEVAEAIRLGKRTVQRAIQDLQIKLESRTLFQLAVRATQLGYIRNTPDPQNTREQPDQARG